MTEYIVDKLPNPNYAGTNCIYLKSKSLDYIQIVFGQKSGIFKVLEDTTLESDKIYLNTLQRTWLNVSLGTKVKTNLISNGIVESISQITFVVKNISAKTNPLVEITDETSNQIANVLEGVVVNPELNLTYLSKLTLIPINMKLNESNSKITSNTQIKLISTDKTIHIETSDTKELFKANFNFNEMGIGGLDKEFEVVFRRAFSSRLIPDKVLKDLGVNHVKGLMLYGLPGCGKCLGKDTPILMYDCSIKMVQDIKIGDKLMGDDSKPRNVLSLARGTEQMYEIEQGHGYLNYNVNESHILSLKMSSMKYISLKRNLIKASYFDISKLKYINKYYDPENNGGIENTKKIARDYLDSMNLDNKIDIEIKDYLKLKKSLQKKLKGYKVGIEFEEKSLDIDPYFLGLWLGDGTSDRPEITTIEQEIIDYLKNTFNEYNINGKKLDPIRYSIVTKNRGYPNSNIILNFLRNNNLIKNKHIPNIYKFNSRTNRLKILAGIIDTDGYYRSGCYYVTQKNNNLSNDIIFLARSLGFRATLNKVKKSCVYKNEKKEGIYNSIIISGSSLHEIPCLLGRKKAIVNPNKNQLCYTIKVNKLSVDNYYGFEIDGNRRFLLGDFTVTHNTLIARQIGKILNCEEPKIVSGPSLLSSYQGQSEKNVRDLFEEAFADKRGKKLYLIILDEFDAIARKRGTIHDAGLSDRIVNQFLSMIDGPESLNNILLIAMTNRLELIDDALLRPGRFEVQIEIGLPDEKGRHDILTIHTNKMNNAGYMRDVNLQEIASKTKNFTGAELESVVKNAVSYCIAKEIDPSNLASIKDIKPIITQTELLKSANEIKPQFGTISREIEIITSSIFELYSNDYKKIYDDMLNKISNLTKGNLLSMLIQGDSYVGKTTLACQVAKNCGLNCVKFISSETLMSYAFKETQLYEIFEQGCRSESLVLVLDCVEKLIEYSKLGNIYNNKILQTIYTILAKIVEPSKSIVVILTSSNKQLSANIDLPIMCNYTYQIFDGAYPSTLSKQVSVYFKEKKFTEC